MYTAKPRSVLEAYQSDKGKHRAWRPWRGDARQEAADRVSSKIKEQPVAAAGAAFGIGVMIGLLFAGRR